MSGSLQAAHEQSAKKGREGSRASTKRSNQTQQTRKALDTGQPRSRCRLGRLSVSAGCRKGLVGNCSKALQFVHHRHQQRAARRMEDQCACMMGCWGGRGGLAATDGTALACCWGLGISWVMIPAAVDRDADSMKAISCTMGCTMGSGRVQMRRRDSWDLCIRL